MNSIAATELKRHGIAALAKLIRKGPVHVIKRNQPVCVVLSEDEYQTLLEAAKAAAAVKSLSVMEWFTLPAVGGAEKTELDERLSRGREEWEGKS